MPLGAPPSCTRCRRCSWGPRFPCRARWPPCPTGCRPGRDALEDQSRQPPAQGWTGPYMEPYSQILYHPKIVSKSQLKVSLSLECQWRKLTPLLPQCPDHTGPQQSCVNPLVFIWSHLERLCEHVTKNNISDWGQYELPHHCYFFSLGSLGKKGEVRLFQHKK